MSIVNQDELKAIKVLKFEGKESEWERWSEKFVALARARGFAGILLGTEQAPNADEDIDRKKTDGSYELTDAERKEKKRLRQANGNAYINLQLSCEDLPYDVKHVGEIMSPCLTPHKVSTGFPKHPPFLGTRLLSFHVTCRTE